MYLSVTCAEDVPWIDPKGAERLASETFIGDCRYVQQRVGVRSVAAGEHPEGVSRAGGRARAHASHLRNVGSGDAAIRRGAGRPAPAEEPVDRRAPRRAQPR